MKRILHMDMDAFFASVEVARNPRLRGRPVVVGGEPGDPRSVVSSASYEARHFGVRSAMPIAEAHRLCPGAVFLRGDHELYGAVSRRIHTLLESVSPLVHMASIDEAYVDITGSLRLFGGEEALALGLKARIRGETGLPCTVAVAANKLVSKVAANEVKPDGCVSIPAGGEAAWLAPLPVGKLPGIGPRTREMLESLGILTVGALAAAPAPTLEPVFGAQNAHVLRAAALGVASDEVETGGAPKSISRETTFPEDLSDWALLGNVAAQLLEHCAHALREEGMETRCLTLKVRYGDFSTHTFSQALPDPTALDTALLETLRGLLPKAMARRARVRLVGVGLSRLSWNQHQTSLFNRDSEEKWERVLERVDRVRGRLGFDAVHLGVARPKPKRRP